MAGKITDLTELTSGNLADGDLMEVLDVSDTSMSPEGTNKKTLWSSIVSKLKTYFDTLYDAAGAASTVASNLSSHTGNTSNPHSVTKAQVGLTNVTDDAQTKAAVVPNTAPSAGQLLVGNAGGTAYAPVSLSSDATVASTGALTLATVNSNVGTYGSATKASVVTVNAKGLVTAVSESTVTPAVGSVTGLGTGVATSLAVNVGTAGAPVVNGGALGTPSTGSLANCTGLPISGLTSSTSTALGVGTLELGAASDTTLARSSAGNITIEGNLVYRAGGSFVGMPIELGYACSDETTALTTGEKVAFYAPFAFNLTSVEVCVTTTPTGSALTVDVESPAGTSLLSAVASISASAFTATGSVSGGTQSVAKGARVSIDIDQIGSTIAGTGLKVTLIGTRA